jgi:hypothetical protein
MSETWNDLANLQLSNSSNATIPSSTGALQLKDLIHRVRYEIGEPSIPGQEGTQSGTWSDQQIIGYLNDCQGLIAKAARLQAAPQTITLTQGQYAYNIPSDCLEDGIRKITWTNDYGTFEVEDVGLDRWVELNAEEANNPTPPLVNMVYCQWGGQIYLFPTPQNNTDTITIYYYKIPPLLVNITDTPLIPSRFHTVLVNYAIGKCQAAVEESQLQMIAMQEFERLSGQLAAERSVENRDRPARVRLRY